MPFRWATPRRSWMPFRPKYEKGKVLHVCGWKSNVAKLANSRTWTLVFWSDHLYYRPTERVLQTGIITPYELDFGIKWRGGMDRTMGNRVQYRSWPTSKRRNPIREQRWGRKWRRTCFRSRYRNFCKTSKPLRRIGASESATTNGEKTSHWIIV